MVFSDDVILEVTADLIFFLLFLTGVVYLIRRDDKRLDLMDTRYNKLIDNMIDTITKQQTNYKEEIIIDIRELSGAILRVLSGVEKIIDGVKNVETEVNRVTQGAKDISYGVNQVVEEVTKVTEQLRLSTTAVERLETPMKEISIRIDKMISLLEDYKNQLKIVPDQSKETKQINKKKK